MDITQDSNELKIRRFKLWGYWAIGILLINFILLTGFPEWLGAPKKDELVSKQTSGADEEISEEIIEVVESKGAEAGLELIDVLENLHTVKIRRQTELANKISKINLTGIAYFGQDNSYCIINDRIVKEGEQIAPDVELTQIHQNKIEVKTNSKTLTLPLKK